MPYVFQAFTQLDSKTRQASSAEPGTGLGLAICKQLVEMMGGQVMVESVYGQGSTFSFTAVIDLQPISSATSSSLEPSSITEATIDSVAQSNSNGSLDTPTSSTVPTTNEAVVVEEKKKDMKILVAEDNKVNQKVIKKMLLRLGYECNIVEDGLQAWEELKVNDYDLILMDVHMPKMDGFQSTQRIRKLERFADESHALYQSRQPVIMALTAEVLDGVHEQCKEVQMNGYLSKPLTLDELESTLMTVERYKENFVEDSKVSFDDV
eukprot:TRINITY_DN664_c0_g1_i1.p1 TRINITY_DN664_c0_g1~~TRINITY_DN664_c0_g1_i1.p1  ORF type:complete len:265 (-),score=62.65 TRINITY_DN664_c0_g1_i1:161-955(-)